MRIVYRNQTPHTGVRGTVLGVNTDAVDVQSDKSGADIKVSFDNIAEVSPLGVVPVIESQVGLAPHRPSGTRAKWAMTLVGIVIGALGLEAALVAQGIGLFSDFGSTTESQVLQWQVDLEAITYFYYLAIVCSAIAFLAWLARAVDNVPALGGGQPIHSPKGAIGWWFVPIVNFVAPYQIVADLWRRMATSHAGRGISIVMAWWALWIAGTVAERVLVTAVDAVTTIDELLGVLTLVGVALVSQIIAGGLLIRIVWQIEKNVDSRASVRSPVANIASPSHGLVAPSQYGDHAAGVDAPRSPQAPAPHSDGDSTRSAGAFAYCPSCGAVRVTGMRFCGACGTNLDALLPHA